MKKYGIAFMAMGLLATGCVDNNYDFSDIDSTARIDVKDLVVPINIDQIKLKSIIDIKDDGKIKVIDGGYAYVQDGTFSTGQISVPSLTVKSAYKSTIDLSLSTGLQPVSGTVPAEISLSLPVPEKTTGYNFTSQKISEDICGLTKVEGQCKLNINISLKGLDSKDIKCSFSDFKLQIPEGLEIQECDGAQVNGKVLTINKDIVNNQLVLEATASSLTIPEGTFDATTHSININGTVGIISGDIKINIPKGANLSLPQNLDINVDFAFGDMDITKVDGTLKYTIDNVNIPEIDITDLPDVLSQQGTNLLLANPCVYLGVNNPLAVCGAYAETGLSIAAYHNNNSKTYSIDKPYFTIAAKDYQNFCLSPSMPATVDKEYADCQHVAFSDLGAILSGDGLPSKLKVELNNPCIPEQKIEGFMLGHTYGDVHGSYKFVAPLQFAEGTNIQYTDKVDGWSSDDLDKLTITNLDVNFQITTDVPVSLELTGYPINKSGNLITGVNISPVQVNSNANAQEVKLSVTGTIKDLDGIEFEAKAKADANGRTLSPDMTISLSQIRPKVTGYYQTEL